jgi:hypothetical protein
MSSVTKAVCSCDCTQRGVKGGMVSGWEWFGRGDGEWNEKGLEGRDDWLGRVRKGEMMSGLRRA